MIGPLRRLLGRRAEPRPPSLDGTARLDAVKAVALQPVLFAPWGIPDRFDGRFEAVLLTAVEYARLVRDGDSAAAGTLLAAFMEDVELALQASGVSDRHAQEDAAVETSAYARVERRGGLAQASAAAEIVNSMFGGSEDDAPRATADGLDSLRTPCTPTSRLAAATPIIQRLSDQRPELNELNQRSVTKHWNPDRPDRMARDGWRDRLAVPAALRRPSPSS